MELLPLLHRSVGCLAAVVTVGSAAPLGAQLRPLEPFDWSNLGVERTSLMVGGGVFTGQRASLAGTEGRLLELGSFWATWSLGRVALQFAGTAMRVFDERTTFAEPLGDVLPAEHDRRHDVGDYRVSTVVSLFEPSPGAGVALRFGVRLPTTNNLKGLDRDRTDFYSLLAAKVARGPLSVSGELGVGIHGTRDPENEQVDPMLFALSARVGAGRVRGLFELAGQHDTRAGAERRGTEDLGEARLGFQVGDRRWMSVAGVRGWTPSSPDLGLIVRFGTHF